MAGMGRAEEESAAGHCNWRKYPINVASGRGKSKAARMGRNKKSHKNIGWEATQAEYGRKTPRTLKMDVRSQGSRRGIRSGAPERLLQDPSIAMTPIGC